MLLTGLFRKARKSLMTKDTDMGAFRDTLNELVSKKDTLSDDEIAEKVESLKSMTADLPDDESKEKLSRFLEDFKSVKEQDAEVAQKAADDVASMFESLDTKAMQDTPDAPGAEEVVTDPEPAAEETETTEETEETEESEDSAPETEETEDDDESKSNAEYTLEEIYQFIKKRMAEDADGGSEEVEETTETEETEGEPEDGAAEPESLGSYMAKNMKDDVDHLKGVKDNAPQIPVTFGKSNARGTLASMFEQIKGGK
jgi:hypothetical protein